MAGTIVDGTQRGVGSPLPSVLEVDETAERDHPREAVSSRHPGLPPTRWRYNYLKCRCEGCTAANAAYVAEARRRRARPDRIALAALLPPGRVKSHIHDLLDAGMSRREISRQALCSDTVIRNILDGQKRVHPRVAAAILDVLPERALSHDDSTPVPGLDPLHVLRLLQDPDELAWKQFGECRRLDLTDEERKRAFFPWQGGDPEVAKEVCNGGRDLGSGVTADPCPVKTECLKFALENNEHGVWGGTHRSERDDLSRANARESE